MPHAEHTDNMSAPTINGVEHKSAFLSHLISYPVVSDSLNTVKSSLLGQKSLDLTHASIERIQPFLSPFYGPYSKITPYITPYLTKADSLGDSALNTLDTKVPAVKKPTGELYDNTKSIAFFPLRKSFEGKEYVIKTYESEIKKVGGEGIVTYGKAAITTTLIVGRDVWDWAAGFANNKKAQAKEVVKEKTNQ